jgi:hypothetical protein
MKLGRWREKESSDNLSIASVETSTISWLLNVNAGQCDGVSHVVGLTYIRQVLPNECENEGRQRGCKCESMII